MVPSNVATRQRLVVLEANRWSCPQPLQALQPTTESGACGAHGGQSDLQSRQVSEQGLLVCRQNPLYALRRGSVWRVVNRLGTFVSVTDRLEARREIGLPNAERESITVAEKQCLELMHHNVGDESARVEARTHLLDDLSGKPVLDGLRALR